MSTSAGSEPDPSERGAESLLLTRGSGHHWSEWVAITILVLTFSVFGESGVAVGLVTAAVWFRLGTPYALATGVVFLVVLTADGVDPVAVSMIGAGLLVLVLAPAVVANVPGAYALATLLTVGTGGGLAWLLVNAWPLWLSAAILIAFGAVLIYGLHRYQLLRLGLLGDEDTRKMDTENA